MNLTDGANIATILVGAIGFISGMYSFSQWIKKLRKKRLEKNHRRYSGEWNNTQEILADHYSHYISLHLGYHRGTIKGTLNIRQGKDDSTWNKLILTGKRSFSTFHCFVLPAANDKGSMHGQITLRQKDGHLEWKLNKEDAAYFPKETVLYKTLPTII